MVIHGKLVRDKVVEHITDDNKTAIYIVLSDDAEFQTALIQKLKEEVEEFATEPSIEELADIFEVLCILTEEMGVTQETVNHVMREKRRSRGGFDRRVYLVQVKDGNVRRF